MYVCHRCSLTWWTSFNKNATSQASAKQQTMPSFSMPSLGWRTSWWRTSVNIQNLFQPRTLPKPVCISEPVWTQNLVRTLNLIERTLPKPGRSGKRAAGWWASWLQNFSQNLTFAPSQNRVSHSWNFAPWKLTALWSFHDKYVTNGYLILSEVPWPNFADLFSYLFSKTYTIFFFGYQRTCT